MSELIGIAITRKIMGKMEEIESANVSISSGIEGDARGKKRNRQITILFEDDWYDACKDCLLYTSPSPRDRQKSRMASSA